MSDVLGIVDGQFVLNRTTSEAGKWTAILDTENKFLDKKISIAVTTPPAKGGAGDTGTATLAVGTTGGTNASNVHGILTSVSARPTASGTYYLEFGVSGGGNSSITQAGWIDTGTLVGSTSSATKFYTLTKAVMGITKNPSLSATAALTNASGVTFTDTNNGIAVQATGSATASGSITASISTAGYAPSGMTATGSISLNSSTSVTKYISGVTFPADKSPTFTVTAGSNTRGIIKIAAFASSTATTVLGSVTVVSNGVWYTTTVTPGSSAKGPYYGRTYVVGNANLAAANIKKGVVIFGVTGTFTSANSVSSGQIAATAGNILSGYSAWVDGSEVKGNITTQTAQNQTIQTQNGYVVLPAGYYPSSSTITAKLPTTSVSQNAWSKNSSNVLTTTYANWGLGYITTGNIPAVTFSNAVSNSSSYIDLTNAKTGSDTFYLPEVTTSRYIYISRGYIDNVAIDIGRFIPDISSNAAASDKILQGYSAYDGEGQLITGTIQSLASTTYTPTTANITITSGVYLSGNQVIKGDAALIKSNIRSGATIFGVAGTFSHTSTLTGSKTAVTAASLRSGYAAFINGA